MVKKALKKITSGHVTIFKIKNRSGYAAVCFNNLTEGKTPLQAYNRLKHPLRRIGIELDGKLPKVK